MIKLILALSLSLSASAFAQSRSGGTGNAKSLQGRAIAPTAPSDTNVLAWVASTGKWTPTAVAAAGATTTLNNLGTTAMNADLIFDEGGPAIVQTKNTASTNSNYLSLLTGAVATSGNSGYWIGGSGASSTSGNTGNVNLQSGNAASGNSGAVTIGPGTATATRGGLYLVDGSEGTAGQFWISKDTSGGGNWTSTVKQVLETVVAGGTCSTTYTVNPTTGTMFNVTLNGACSFAVTGLAAGHSFTIKITQSSTTAPTFTSAYKWATATTPTFSTSATKYDMIACVSLDGTTLDCSAVIDVR